MPITDGQKSVRQAGLKDQSSILPRNVAAGHYMPHTTVKVSVQAKQLTGQKKQF